MSERKVYMVWDGGSLIEVPPPMGTPREDQFQGTPVEKVAELAGRVCYDSLGQGRDTDAYLKHITDVGHLSVLEHFHATFLLFITKHSRGAVIESLSQRPGVYFRAVPGAGPGAVRITMNARAMLEWDSWTEKATFGQVGYPQEMAYSIGIMLRGVWHDLAPRLIPEAEAEPDAEDLGALNIGTLYQTNPEHPDEVWITLHMEGSRGFSHELVRHGNFTAISQRSTRYVDEDESPWDWHPLIDAYLAEEEVGEELPLKGLCLEVEGHCQTLYQEIVKRLHPWLLEKIPEGTPYRKTTARKQARGSARGFLGNALRTAVIFTASVTQWRHMMRMRAADAADAEIRMIFSEALPLLKSSSYGSMFDDLQLGAAGDGLGLSLVDGGAR